MKVRRTRGWLHWLVPILLTGGAAALGYGFAIYPIWSRAHEARDGWAVPTVMTPFVGYAPAPGKRRNAFISAKQFRGERELTTPKPPGVTRVFITGGAMAFGSGAPGDELTVGAYLQRALDRLGARQYEVFTFATPGWLSTHARIAIENRLSELEPDLVIWLTGDEDLLASEAGRNVMWSRAAGDQYYWSLASLALKRSGWGQMVDVQDVSSHAVPPQIVASRLRRNVDLGALALAMRRARLLVFLEPNIITTRKALSAGEERILSLETSAPFENRRDYYARCHERIEALFRGRELSANVSYADLTGVFDASAKEQAVFADGFHFGDRGNSMIADAIGKVLSETIDKPSERLTR